MAIATKIIPVLRYRDPSIAAQWLGRAFGFIEHETVRGADGEVAYVLLQSGTSFVLVLPDVGLDGLLVQPQAVGGANTQVCYVTVADADAHRARAESAGAQIEIAPQDDGLGGQFYTCRDFEGHLWSFGTRAYGVAGAEAGQRGAEEPGLAPADATVRSGRRSAARMLAGSVGVAAAVTLAAAGGWMAHRTYTVPDAASVVKEAGATQQLAQERQQLAAAESAAKEAEERLAEQLATAGDVRRALQQAQSELLQARSDLTLERQRKGESAAALASLKGAAADLERGKARAEAELAAGRERIAQEKALAKAAAERATALQAQIDKLRQDRGAERENLSKAKAALQSAEAQLKALREAKAQQSAAPAGPPPPAAVQPQDEAEKLAAALAAVMPPAGAAEPGTAKVKVPDLPEPPAKTAPPKAACVVAVEGRWKTPGPWAARLCQGAETSPEPVRCYEELMRGKVSWGAGTAWTAPHALTLCSGSRNARQTIDCFSGKIAEDEPWQAAIQGCRSN